MATHSAIPRRYGGSGGSPDARCRRLPISSRPETQHDHGHGGSPDARCRWLRERAIVGILASSDNGVIIGRWQTCISVAFLHMAGPSRPTEATSARSSATTAGCCLFWINSSGHAKQLNLWASGARTSCAIGRLGRTFRHPSPSFRADECGSLPTLRATRRIAGPRRRAWNGWPRSPGGSPGGSRQSRRCSDHWTSSHASWHPAPLTRCVTSSRPSADDASGMPCEPLLRAYSMLARGATGC